MKYLLILIAVGCLTIANAQDYNVALIPDSLKKNADVVVRNEEVHVQVKAMDKVIIKHKYAITILNENGDEYAEYSNWYDPHQPLSDIDGNLYDATGKKLKNVKRKDIQDAPMQDGISLMNDTRIKMHNFYWRNYPYTVEYEDEQELNQTYGIPRWRPVQGLYHAVQNSSYTIETPLDFKIKYKSLNFSGQPQTVTGRTQSITWNLRSFKALLYEPFLPPVAKLAPAVLVSPVNFSYGSYTGSIDTWSDLGKFQLALNKDRDILPDNVKGDVHKIADGLATTEDKVKALYQYMQSNTRYISIQLGIGGMQPFDAKYVSEKKYGDCKALSNYMVSLLKEANIPAYYVQIKSGEKTASDYLIEDFPSDYFDHIVCCVPNGKDSIWLECTSQTVAAGFMGSFTGNRKALLIASDGGHVVSTPIYKASDNLQLRRVEATIDADGNLDANVHTTFTGEQQELQHSLMYDANKEQREKYLNEAINLPTYKVDKNDYSEVKNRIPVIQEDLHIASPNYAAITGKRLFIKPDLFNKSSTRLSKDSVRNYAIAIRSSYKDVDTVIIKMPAGYTLEAMPKDVALESKFGKYSISFKVGDNAITMLRTNEVSAITLPASEYEALVNYYDAMYKADHGQMVFVKKDN